METQKTIKSPDMLRENRVPPGQRLANHLPVLHYGEVPKINLDNWRLTICGLVAEKRDFSFKEFNALEKVKVLADIHCVTRWSLLNTTWSGVSTLKIKEILPPLPNAHFVIVHGANSFTTNLPLEDFFQPDVLLATEYNGELLSPEHGYPVRLVVPRLYFWKSAKWVTGIEFVEKDKAGFWESAGYHNHGDPWVEERYG
jgi:DMSO/TMAO reductase YedYZ molybdopterin-dependent catalytic subunit